MPVFFEFLLVALLIYLWESSLWLPKHGVTLRHSWFRKNTRTIHADRLLAMRELGLIPLLPFLPDLGITPATSLPLAIGTDGAIYIQTNDGTFHKTNASKWEDIHYSQPHLKIGQYTARLQSPQAIHLLRSAKIRGLDPKEAIHHTWKLMLSPSRAKHTQNYWKLLTSPLRIYCPILTLGFFAGIPATYLTQGPLATALIASWLWLIMLAISISLFRIAKRAYPQAKAEIRQDAILSLLIPFHAMRAYETLAVHAFSSTHPAAILLSTGATDHTWLKTFIRKLLIPLPTNPGDQAICATILAQLRKHINPEPYLTPPDLTEDPEAHSYCPRCHSLFLEKATTCSDCQNIKLTKS